MMGFPFFLIPLLSLTMMVLVGIGLITYIRHNWHGSRLDSDETDASRLLDGIERIEFRLTAMSERLERLERRLGEGGAEGRLERGGAETEE